MHFFSISDCAQFDISKLWNEIVKPHRRILILISKQRLGHSESCILLFQQSARVDKLPGRLQKRSATLSLHHSDSSTSKVTHALQNEQDFLFRPKNAFDFDTIWAARTGRERDNFETILLLLQTRPIRIYFIYGGFLHQVQVHFLRRSLRGAGEVERRKESAITHAHELRYVSP
jgi:hypothetical protein